MAKQPTYLPCPKPDCKGKVNLKTGVCGSCQNEMNEEDKHKALTKYINKKVAKAL